MGIAREAPSGADLVVVGAGPGGSAAAAWAARAGQDVLLLDAATFPRDKACGDGLTPRAVGEMQRLGLGDWLADRPVGWGLQANGFGQTLHLPWPGGSLPRYGSAAPRFELDAAVRGVAVDAGAVPFDGARAVDVEVEAGRVTGVWVKTGAGGALVSCDRLVVADGARSQLGRRLGRQWHKETVYGVAARAYVPADGADDPWITSHLELRGSEAELLSGYGWVFPLGGAQAPGGLTASTSTGGAAPGLVNIGVGTLATDRRPARTNLRALLARYVDARREDFGLYGQAQVAASALLPMGGAVSGVAGENWVLVGDAAGGVNPLNGEGIDYALEMGRLAVELMAYESDLTVAWPLLLRARYGAAFSVARRLAALLTVPKVLQVAGPVGMRSRSLMTLVLRVMGNLITEADSDVVARLWRGAGSLSMAVDERQPFVVPTLDRSSRRRRVLA